MHQLEQCKKYSEELLNKNRDKYKPSRLLVDDREADITIVGSITKIEIFEALRKCNNECSQVPGGFQ